MNVYFKEVKEDKICSLG